MTYTVVDDVVQTISLASIPAGCNGGDLSLTLVNSSNTAIGSVAPTTITGTSQTVTVTGNTSALAIATSYVSVAGP